ncbi:hypothetical protein QJS10_CPA07g00308 [Acorus calamus]|uniref:Uncharacterized protein n=1 Tax=Acorus calamus TaxID=4465 RepID=A0AAV9EH83_ACOCL|nr:hypothetical protein QJS10_CPA07g00308 [Acorus calamus]
MDAETRHGQKKKEIGGGECVFPFIYGGGASAVYDVAAVEAKMEEVLKCMDLVEEISFPCFDPSIDFPVSYYHPFVTINGNEESCGPSFSDSASTVMASIDTTGGGSSAVPYFLSPCFSSSIAGVDCKCRWVPPTPQPQIHPWLSQEANVVEIPPPMMLEDVGIDEDDEEWLAKVLSGADLEEW